MDVDITEEGVLNLLLNIDIKKNPGPDGIPNEFLYTYAEWISKFLNKLSANNGCVPVAWKCAKIVPVHKSGPTSAVDNYRGGSRL